MVVITKKEILKKLYAVKERIVRERTEEKDGTPTKSTVIQTVVSFVQLIGVNFLIYAILLMSVIGIIAIIVGMLIQAITNGLAGLDGLFDGKPTKQTVGAKYVWNETDLNKFTDEWSRNLYRLGWIITANKELYNSDVSIELMMGLPVAETGSNFYPTGTDHREPTITSGAGKNWNSYSIAKYATVGGDFPWNGTYDYITGLYAIDANLAQQAGDIKYTWGCPAENMLATDTIGTRHEGYISTYADGDVMKSVYSVAYSVAYTINSYENSRNAVFNKDAEYGNAHMYHKYWVKAAEKYGLNAEDEKTQRQIYTLMYYLLHAGGVWSYTDIADDFNTFVFDYTAYLLTNVLSEDITNIRLVEQYSTTPDVKNITNVVMRGAARGNANINHAQATVWNEPVLTNGSYLEVNTAEGWKTIEDTTVGLWLDYNTSLNTAEANKLVAVYKKTYLHTNETLVRQANYAVSTCICTVATGASRLKYLFDTLNIQYTTNDEGYICYAGGQHGDSGAVPDGYIGGDFELAEKVNGYTNVRDNTWFVQLDNTEWSNPLNPNINGGIEVTSRYGYRMYNGWTWHSGMDMVYKTRATDIEVLRENYPEYAMHDGVVVAVNDDINSNAGRYVHYKVTYMRDGKEATVYFTYMHLSKIADGIGVGSQIKAGEIIGYMGGSASGSEYGVGVHLHISMSTNPTVGGNPGRIDIETELPFVTMYSGYRQWDGTTGSGCLKQRPKYPLQPNEKEPQAP